jgi:hypothetical protein
MVRTLVTSVIWRLLRPGSYTGYVYSPRGCAGKGFSIQAEGHGFSCHSARVNAAARMKVSDAAGVAEKAGDRIGGEGAYD